MYTLFYDSPIPTLAFFALAMGILSLWIYKTPWFYASFFVIAYFLAHEAKIVTLSSLLPICALGGCYLAFKKTQGALRLLLFFAIAVLSMALGFHLFHNFHNWHIIDGQIVSPNAYPYNLWMNFDKPWIGIFPLLFTIPLLRSKSQIRTIMIPTLLCTFFGIAALLALSLKTGVVDWDLKIPNFFVVWCIVNLLFVTIPEEAFFRGFFQRELTSWLGSGLWAKVGGVFGTSLFFTLIHASWVPSLPFLGSVFLASVLYGTLYEATDSIESCIFCHFTLNLCHLLLLTYPALQG